MMHSIEELRRARIQAFLTCLGLGRRDLSMVYTVSLGEVQRKDLQVCMWRLA